MKKIMTLLILMAIAHTAKAELEQLSPEVQAAITDVKFNAEKFEKIIDNALNRAVIKTNVRVHCSIAGLQFAKKMAKHTRELINLVPKTSSTNLSNLERSTEATALKYENLCEKSVSNALRSGLSEQEIIALITVNVE